jgi:2-amino-4-hydroxy-6-hydroxymethyldihydropteridine diphosphokinase
MRVGIALGSNLGDRLDMLKRAHAALLQIPGVDAPVLLSAVYATAPVDCEEKAAEFLNAVMEFEYEGHPRELLPQLKAVEASLGRPSDHGRNVSRAIDVDLLYFDEMEIQDEGLKLPHPRMTQRRFVLQPLADIRPGLILPGQTKSVSELLAWVDKSAEVVRLTNEW